MSFEVATAHRTLVASGYRVVDFLRHEDRTDFVCDCPDPLGVTIPYYFVFFHSDSLSDGHLQGIGQYIRGQGRLPVFVTPQASTESIPWEDFTAALGGAIPSWRALGEDFPALLIVAASNSLPAGTQGEAWALFEELVADGLEFLFGHRVHRLGSRRRVRPVSDMIAQTPDRRVILVDAKASSSPFDVGIPELRPLSEYLHRHQHRQTGADPISAVTVVAAEFRQDEDRLQELSDGFLAEERVPLSFLRVDTLITMINALIHAPWLRNRIRWSHIVCAGSLVSVDRFNRDVDDARAERFPMPPRTGGKG
ncbi:MAG: hypothetical protein WD906_07065 [Anaerolineales bacterium]